MRADEREDELREERNGVEGHEETVQVVWHPCDYERAQHAEEGEPEAFEHIISCDCPSFRSENEAILYCVE